MTKSNRNLNVEPERIERISTTLTGDGAWCWFADPRALRHVNAVTGSDKTYIGYIDVAGSIQAVQYDHVTQERKQVRVRAGFQQDDHNNPTFLALPDGRVMIFYSEHSTTPYIYYRVTTQPDDLETLGPEKIIDTTGYGNTTYPSPFVLTDQPDYFYLLWRGVNWHPTVARFTLPDPEGDVSCNMEPKQIVDSRCHEQETGKRPYAKYETNGKDKIMMTYTYTHPDNMTPNSLYYSYLDVNTLTLHGADGHQLADLNRGPLKLDNNETDPAHLVDRLPGIRNWNWDIAPDKEGCPVILFVRINADKDRHHYCYAKWSGSDWQITPLADGGRWFHQNEERELCYSGGMSLDHNDPSTVYISIPVQGKYGEVFEIHQCVIADDGSICNIDQVTENSTQNNVRPFVVRHASPGEPYDVIWMHGDYYYWDHSQGRLGYTTGLQTLCEDVAIEDERRTDSSA